MRDGERKEKTKTCKKTLEKRREIKKHEPIFNFIYIYIIYKIIYIDIIYLYNITYIDLYYIFIYHIYIYLYMFINIRCKLRD